MPGQLLKILIVDDSEADRDVARLFLEQRPYAQYTFETAGTAARALEVCGAFEPDCILLDYTLPDMDGLDLLARLQDRFGKFAHAYVCFTGTGDELIAVQALQQGAQDYLPKAILSPETLSRAVLNAIDKLTLQRDRERARLELAKTAKLLRSVISAAPAIVYVIDIPTGKPVFLSDHVEDALGYDNAKIADIDLRLLRRLAHPDDLDRIVDHHKTLAALPDDVTLNCEYRVKHKDGDWRWLHSRDQVFERDPKGRVQSVIGTATDCTERKRLELIVKTYRERLDLAKRTGLIGFWDWNVVTDESHCSASYFSLYGLSQDSPNPRFQDWLKSVHPDDRAAARKKAEAALAGEPYDSEFRIVWPDGSVHWLSGLGQSLSENGSVVRLVGVNIDITERKAAEEELRQANEKLQALLDIAPAAIFVSHDAEGARIDGNLMSRELLELPAGSNASKTAPVSEPIRMVSRTGKEIRGHECELLFEDGRRKSIYGHIRPLFDAGGLPAGAVAAYVEVTGQKNLKQFSRHAEP